MKKKLFTVILAAILTLSFASCANISDSSSTTERPSETVTASFGIVNAAITLNVGGTEQISLKDVVSLSSADFTYSSYDPSVATVSESGLVTAVDEGETTILVKAGDLRKQVTVTVSDPYKLNNVSYAKLKALAAISGGTDGIGISPIGAGGDLSNYAWHGGTNASTAGKADFEGTSENTAAVARTAVANKNYASVDNGDYVVVMSAMNGNNLPQDAAHCAVYYKTVVSPLANAFRLWGWASKSDSPASPASGKGSFRVVAYAFNADYTEYEEYPLVAADKGSLEQDENGWITYDDVDDTLNGHIANAPADNMFIYHVKTGSYDLIGKEIILTVEFMGVDTSMPDRFGIKRLGFMLDDEPNIALTSAAQVELFSGNTAQIEVSKQGAATRGTMVYASDNSEVATVSETGLITAGNVDEESACVITVTNTNVPSVELKVNVTVKPIPETSFNVPAGLTVSNGTTAEITITDKVSCEAGFSFRSLSEVIATVSNAGVVTGVTPGKTSVRVTCGELYKDVPVTVTATSLYGLNLNDLKAMGNLGTVGGFPAALDFTWSGKTTADNISAANTDAKIHLYAKDGTTLNDLGDPSLVNMICNIGGNGTAGVQNALYYKANTPAAANEYRVWIRTAQVNNADMCDEIYVRVVTYYLNEDGTAYIPYVMKLNAFTDAAATASQDANSGIIHISGGTAGDAFMNFVPTAEIFGKEGVIIAIETFALGGSVQYRAIVRRMGFDA
ncbi:MAG: Ig-like domain-containing protein [Clostridia bacterium]|nr:Ig-like domain-containing protein [Clostridia bacterium]